MKNIKKTIKTSRYSRGSNSSKEMEFKDKIRVGCGVNFLVQKERFGCETQRQKIRKELAKARAGVSTYDETQRVDLEEDCRKKTIVRQQKQLDHDGRKNKAEILGKCFEVKQRNQAKLDGSRKL